MPAAPTVRPRVLTVGAYERDNFGDLLFLLVTEKYLPGADVVAAAPFAADMTELLDRRIGAYGDLLREERFDAIWTVGGQIGGTSMESAYRMSMAPAIHAEFKNAPYAQQRKMLAAAVNGAPLISPYLPTPAAFPLNAGAVSVVNSCGLAGVRSRPWHQREELLEVLRSSDAVSVRDVESSNYLGSAGIAHTLVPDVVHALGAIDPFERDPEADNVVVQCSSGILRLIGHKKLARRLVESSHLDDLRIRFLLAGTATGHDSVEAFEKVAAEIARIAPSREVEIIADRDPMALVDHIRRARVVIGSSLHVRIVSAAYHLPRLTFTRAKPAAYAAHWDPEMPYNVDLPDLDREIGRALDLARRDETVAASTELVRLADTNVRALADLVLSAAAERSAAEIETRAQARITAYTPIVAQRKACEPQERNLRIQLDEVTRELAATKAELAAERARNVPAEPIAKRARRAAGKVRRKVSRG